MLVGGAARGELAPLPGVTHRVASLDVGYRAAEGTFAVDVEATRLALAHWLDALPARVEAEAERLAQAGARAVVADVPAVALLAAARLGLPAAVVSNFSWLDMYGATFGPGVTEVLARAYASARLGVRLWPGGLPLEGVPRVVDVPARGVLARVPRAVRGPRSVPVRVALAFGKGLAWDPGVLVARVEAAGGAPFVARTPDDLVSADLVLAKAGYSTIAEALLAAAPLVCVPVPDQRESQAIAADVASAGLGLAMSLEELLGALVPGALEGLMERARPQGEVRDGAAEVLGLLAEAGVG